MRNAGYLDLEQGEYQSTEEHLTITQFKVEREKERQHKLQRETEEAYENAQETQHKLDEIASVLQETIDF